MRKMEFMLKDSFEVTGQWWVPEKPDDKDLRNAAILTHGHRT